MNKNVCSWLLLLGIAVSLTVPALAQGGGRGGGPGFGFWNPPESQPIAPKAEIDWDIAIASWDEEFWNMAPGMVQLTSSLRKTSQRPLQFEFHSDPIIELTPILMRTTEAGTTYQPNGPPLRKSLANGRGVRAADYNAKPAASEACWSVTLDLREYFDKLPPGLYEAQLIWPAEGYKVGRSAVPISGQIASPKWQFNVLAVPARSQPAGAGNPGSAPPPAPAAAKPPAQAEQAPIAIHSRIELPEVVSDHDSVWLKVSLRTNTPKGIGFEARGNPRVEVVPPSGDVRMQEVPYRSEAQQWHFDSSADQWRDALSLRLDLRRVLGSFTAGQYKVRLVWPKDALAAADAPEIAKNDLATPWRIVTVVPTSLQAASKELSGPDFHRMITKAGEATADGTPLATITNTSKATLYLPYLAEKAPLNPQGLQVLPPKPPLDAPLQLVRAAAGPGASLYGQGWQPESTVRPERFPLPPGESVKILLPDWKADGDGIYTYRVTAFDAERHFWGYLVSEPQVIDSPSAAKAATDRK